MDLGKDPDGITSLANGSMNALPGPIPADRKCSEL